VLPGITGLAQVNGRNGLSIFDKIKYDIEYAKNVSFIMDLKITVKTIIIVFKKEHSEIIQEDIQDELNLLSNNS
jgi:lipopolysaccharide/colanic/teichoic acid biosynthesis glycosyltransferase